MTDQEHFCPRSKKVRGMATRSLDLIDAMVVIAAQTRPITGRGIANGFRGPGSLMRPARSRKYRRGTTRS
jgi:hypothetical protein